MTNGMTRGNGIIALPKHLMNLIYSKQIGQMAAS